MWEEQIWAFCQSEKSLGRALSWKSHAAEKWYLILERPDTERQEVLGYASVGGLLPSLPQTHQVGQGLSNQEP